MISVCIATYNGEKYIFQQLESILSQIGDSDEIIISDDSSSDRTLEIVKSFEDQRIKIFENQTFKNPIFNFENALIHSKGEFIFLSDQDDIWQEQKVEKMLLSLQDADMVLSDCSFIDAENRVILDSYFKLVKSGPGVLRNLRKNSYFGCCMGFRRKILKKALPFPKDIPMHDIWLGFVSDLFFRVVFLDEKLTLYRKHSNNASIASDVVSNLNLYTKLKFRVNTVKYIPALILR